MKKHDHVKVTFPPESSIEPKVRFGEIETWSAESKKAAKKGQLIFEDVVTGERIYVSEAWLTDIEYSFSPPDAVQQHAFEESIKGFAAAAKVKGCAPGALLTIGVGDGNAWYMVSEVRGSKVKIVWRGYSPDRWVDQRFGYGGSFPKSMIAPFIVDRHTLLETIKFEKQCHARDMKAS